MSGRSKTVETKSTRITGHAKRAVANQPSAKQRRGFGIGIGIRNGEAEALICDGVFGVATIDLVAGEASFGAQVLAT